MVIGRIIEHVNAECLMQEQNAFLHVLTPLVHILLHAAVGKPDLCEISTFLFF